VLPRRDEAGVGALPDQVKAIPLYRDAPQRRYESGGSEIGKLTLSIALGSMVQPEEIAQGAVL
jgi:hypothetical protein